MREVSTDAAPASIGPYSQGIRDGDAVHVSGQGPIDPATGDVVDGDVSEQTARTLENVDAVLRAAGGSLDDATRATVYVADMADYDAVNEVYAEYLSEPYPARSAVEVAAFPVDIDVEIEITATVPR
jgi:2-iminobutanoate/2-iminopropanoate deaminase